MAQANITITIDLTGLPTGSRTVQMTPPTLGSAVGEERPNVPLAIGENPIDVPVGTKYVAIQQRQPATTLEVRTVTNQTGVPLDTAGWSLLRWPSAQPLILLAASAGAVDLLFV